MISGTQRRCSVSVNRPRYRIFASSNRLRCGSCHAERYGSSARYWFARSRSCCWSTPTADGDTCLSSPITTILGARYCRNVASRPACDASSTITTSNMSPRIWSCSAIRYTGMIHTGTDSRQRSIAWRTSALRCVAYFPVPLPSRRTRYA
jgi:hypothetical protein